MPILPFNELPVVYEIDGNTLTGRVDISTSCDVSEIGVEQAKRDMQMVLRSAFFSLIMRRNEDGSN